MSWSIRARLLTAFGAMLVMVALVGLDGWWNVRGVADEFTQLSETNLKASIHLADAERGLWELRFGLANYLLWDATRRVELRQKTDGWFRQVDDNLAAYGRLPLSEGERSILREWKSAYVDYVRARPKFLDLVDAGNMQEANAFRVRETNPAAAAAVQALSRLVSLQKRLAQDKQVSVARRAADATRMLVLVSAVALALGVALSLLLSRQLTGPLHRLVRAAEEIARGDLRGHIAVERRDELGQLVAAMQRMLEGLRVIVRELRDGAEALGTTADQLASTASRQAGNMAAQAGALQQASVALEEIRATVRQANEWANRVLANSARSEESSAAAREVLEHAVGAMADLRGHTVRMTREVEALGGRARRIDEITGAVDALARQSQLLAVNAALEATRAGEAGRGFRVVADHVRMLADRSRGATAEVRTLLTEIRNATETTIVITEEGGRRVDSGVARVSEVGAKIVQLGDAIRDASESSRRIAGAAGQQAAGIEQIADAVRQVSGAAQESLGDAQRQEQAAQQLNAMALRLQGLVQHYRLS